MVVEPQYFAAPHWPDRTGSIQITLAADSFRVIRVPFVSFVVQTPPPHIDSRANSEYSIQIVNEFAHVAGG